MIGALSKYISTPNNKFQPMNANFGIMKLETEVRKSERKEAYAKQALAVMEEYKKVL